MSSEHPVMNGDAVLGDVVRSFFASMEECRVPWAVLRGSDGLPAFTRYDIDLLIRPEDVNRAETVLGSAAEAHGWRMIRIIDKFRYRCCLLVGPGGAGPFVPVDFFGGCFHRFREIADSGYALRERRRNAAGVWVVPEGFGAALALLKELLRHPVFKEDSRLEVRRGALADRASFEAGVKTSLGDDLCRRLLELVQSGNWAGVEQVVPELRRAVAKRAPTQILWRSEFLLKNLRHHWRPSMSVFVVLLGPDGSGKSTVADLVAQELYKKPFKVCRRFEHRFRVLPELKAVRRFARRLTGSKPPELRPPVPGTRFSGMNPELGMLRGMGQVAYYTVDYLLGWGLLALLRGRGSAVIFARYYYDYYYQRGYGRIPRWYLRALESLIPRPDLILCLERDAGAIFEAKPELEVDEIRRQQAVLRTWIAGCPQAAMVDASAGLTPTVQRVCEHLRGFFLRQHEGR